MVGSVEEPLDNLRGDPKGLLRPGIFEPPDLGAAESFMGGMERPLLGRLLGGLISFLCGVSCIDSLSALPSLLLLVLLDLI